MSLYGDWPPFSPAAATAGDLGGLLDLDRDPLLEAGVRDRDLLLDLDLERERDGDFVALVFLFGEVDLERE